MKFYKTHFRDRHGEVTVFWETSRDRAVVRLRQMQRAAGMPEQTGEDGDVQELDVPSSRIELLAWLNRHAIRA